MRQALYENKSPIVWFHAASLGEFEQGRPVMETLRIERPDVKILLTFFSPSGYEIRQNYDGADWIFYLPIDSPSNARNFVDIVNPTVAVFIKYEYWYCYLKYLNREKIPVLLVSAIFRENQFFFHRIGGFYRTALRWIDHYFVQDHKSLDLIKSIGIQDAEITGDTRYDRVLSIASEAKSFPLIDAFKSDESIMVCGSTWPSDIEVLTPFIKEQIGNMKFIIAPHNLSENEIDSIASQFENAVRYSRASEYDISEKDVLIIDNIGMLSSLYRYGEFAYVGGALRGSLHNTLEAAVYGIPVVFGDAHSNEKFREAVDLVESGGAFAVTTPEGLIKLFDELTEIENYSRAALAAGQLVKSRAGATRKVITKMLELLP